jgi:cleavage and polyadenylation specificity factor subunit 1
VFTDDSGIYRSFEAQTATDGHDTPATGGTNNRVTATRSNQQSKIQLTADQVLRLQNEKPAISTEEPSIQNAMNASQGSHRLAVVTERGLLQVCLQILRDMDLS